MGLIADMERDFFISDDTWEDLQEFESRPQPTKTTWVTREGEPILIAKMEDGHLLNTIRMLRRKGIGEKEKDTPFFDTMLKLARKRRLTK